MAIQEITNATPDDSMARAGSICKWVQFSKSTLWRKSADGSFVKATKLSTGITAWRVGDVRQWLKQQA
jgi:predicted DNA-binding transcriptional regulator AlpA